MKKTPKTIQVDQYTDDDGNPVCGECSWNEARRCCHAYSDKWHNKLPGPDCPVWRKQDDTGAGAQKLCTWWRCAGLDKDPDTEDD
jgi:hypothetical protein